MINKKVEVKAWKCPNCKSVRLFKEELVMKVCGCQTEMKIFVNGDYVDEPDIEDVVGVNSKFELGQI